MNKQLLEKIGMASLIEKAIKEPGELSKCYSLFHDYSLLNTLYIFRQLRHRGLPIEPIKGYKAWGELNRKVRPDEMGKKTPYGFTNGIEILFPKFSTFPKKDANGEIVKDKDGNPVMIKVLRTFNYYRWHFSASQTDIIDPSKKTETMTENRFNIDIPKLCKALDIEIVDYDSLDGNCQGWAIPRDRKLAINPVAEHITETAIHEIAHIVLDHNNAKYERAIKEVEAETVAYIVLTVCNNENIDLSNNRAYIQKWLGSNEMTDEIANRIMRGASKILDTLKEKKDKGAD